MSWGVNDARECWQEGRQGVSYLLASEFVVGVLQVEVGHQVVGTCQLIFCGWVLHEVERPRVDHGGVLARRYSHLERARGVIPGQHLVGHW